MLKRVLRLMYGGPTRFAAGEAQDGYRFDPRFSERGCDGGLGETCVYY